MPGFQTSIPCARHTLVGLVLLTTALCTIATRESMAQAAAGAVRGAVRDGDAVVPGVTVILLNEATSASRETVTNDAGDFSFPAVVPGAYTLRASLPGFKTWERQGLSVTTRQTITVDIRLEVGGLEETVTVTAAPPVVDTSNASVGSVLEARELSALPSVARNIYMMSVTVPTVVLSGNQVFTRLQDLNHPSLVSLGGGARRANNYLIDGVSHTDLVNRPSVNPSLETIESVSVQLHTYDAEMGRTGGGTYNVSARSGTNQFRGSTFYQVRPGTLVANNFFAARAGLERPDSYFHNGGGGIGGPIVRGRTFVWQAGEAYRSLDSRSSALRVPTMRERLGDFSQSLNAAGQLVVIYDPLTTRMDPVSGRLVRDPFPGNVIPGDRLNPVAAAIAQFYPQPTRDVSDGAANRESVADQTGHAVVSSTKIDHRFGDRVSLSALYMTNGTSRTNENFWERGQGPNRFADPRDGTLDRSLHLLALNNTWVTGDNTVVTLRYGYTRLRDDDSATTAFDPAVLGFSTTFLNAQQAKKFPTGAVTDYESFGAVDPTDRVWGSWSANGTLSRLVGRHTFKAGVDLRRLGVNTQSFTGGSGDFRFDRFFTSADPLANGTATSGNALASFLLGYPSGDPANQSRLTVSSPLDASVRYYGAYLQDDLRVNERLSLNVGLRVEHESGLRERLNRFTVGFDRTIDPGGALGAVVVNGRPVRGGLVFPGQAGAPLHQGNPPPLKPAPRAGLAFAVSPRTALRGGYGVFWAPWNYQPVSGVNYGQMGYVSQTFIAQDQFVPDTSLDNPFPGGAVPPLGSSLGPLTGVGGQVEFVDQSRGAPWVQQYSVDITHQVGDRGMLGLEYVGATGRSLGLGGSNDAVLNINQLDPVHLALGASLLEQVPNPFHGLPTGEGFAVNSPTVQRRQLLRPFPQFGDILMRQSTQGRSQYHALVLKAERRFAGGWGARVNYTVSRLHDNQFGETNFQQPGTAEALDAYDLSREWSVGLLDVPHKFVAAPIVDLPFGPDGRWARRGLAAALLGGWNVSAIISLESGFPIPLTSLTNNTGLFTRVQRPNATGAPADTEGSDVDRIVTGWLNPAAYVDAPPFTLGTAPRTDTRVRGPARNNVDMAIARSVRLGERTRGEIRLEVINLTNTVKVIGPIQAVGSAGFGQVRAQSGFMRLAQLTFRLSF
jgi:hypothetical protein